ncbi:MAG: phosphoribosyltransferase [Bacteroidetes bacterium]|jgi:ComF family protein|nr:phosphoribosyltransferase [Bacteroidota bacterium]
MKNLINNMLNLFFPDLCVICNDNLVSGEEHICKKCLNDIPRTNYHRVKDNPIEKKFWGKVTIYRGTSFYFFTKGSPYQKVLHELKYKNNKEIGLTLGKYAAADLLDSTDFRTVDVVIPVPLHQRKLAQRGYNQSEWIARGLCMLLQCSLDQTTLIRKKHNPTQTKKSVYERYENTEGVFELTETSGLENKHVLLVDDVLTTGSTLEAAAKELLQIRGIRVSIFTLAVA